MFVDYNVERILKVVLSFIFHFKEDNLGLGIIEVRPYKLVMRTIHAISCDAYKIQLSSPKKSDICNNFRKLVTNVLL